MELRGFWALMAFALVSGVVFALPPGGVALALVYFASDRAGERLPSRRLACVVALTLDDAVERVRFTALSGSAPAAASATAVARVASSATGAGSGMGLAGMRERAALLGGSPSAGPGPAGVGWNVTLELPL